MLLVRRHGPGLWPLFLLVFLAVDIATAAIEDCEGKPVGIIAFDPKEQPIPASELFEMLPLKSKRPFRMAEVRASIERLFATGRYADIAVDAELRDSAVIVRFLTKSNWFVGRVTVEGVPLPPSRGQLVNATQLDLGKPLYEEDLPAAVQRLAETLRANGFFDHRIRYELRREPRTQQIDIRFLVEPGRRARYAEPVIRGATLLPARKVARATRWKGWRGWKKVTQARTQQGLEEIRKLFQKQQHLMVQVGLEKIEYDPRTGWAIPYLHIEPGPVVIVEARGADLGRKRLRELVPVFEEGSVDRELLAEGARNIAEYLQAQGFFGVEVDYAQEHSANGVQKVVYGVRRGPRHKVALVQVRGNRYFDAATIRERMLVVQASPQFRRGRFSQALLKRDVDAIVELYRSNGFRDVKVTSEVRDNQPSAGQISVFVNIEEGPQWFVSNLQIDGVNAGDLEVLRSLAQSGPGQPFSEANVAADRDNFLAWYFGRGYSDASFEWTFQPSATANRVDLHYRITEGEPQYVREVLIGGLEATQRRLVYRRILLNPGDPVSQAQVLETQRRLYDLGIFAKVDTAIQNPDGDEPHKYVQFQLEESRKYSVSTGFGAEIARIGGSQTSLESPAGKAGFSPRVSFDISRLNFLGRAHTVSLRSRVSTIQRRALFNYFAPQIRGMEKLDLSLSALFDESRDIRTFSARRWEGSLQFVQRYTLSKSLFYRFSYRRVSVSDVKIQPELIPRLSQPARVGMPSVGYVDDRRDDPVDSRKGTYNSLDLGVASKYFGSEADFSRLLGRNSTYHPLGSKLVLARTFLFGWIHTVSRNPDLLPGEQDIPLPERFFAGGATTHRGFPENQAGPRDLLTGFPIGGKALLVLGHEIRFPLYGANLGGVLFHDAGNVYSRLGAVSLRVRQRDETDFNYMVHAVGLGIRYRTPIGPIRADFAYVPNSPAFFGCEGRLEDLIFGCDVRSRQRISRFQFHFSLGQTF